VPGNMGKILPITPTMTNKIATIFCHSIFVRLNS
jgi:hypothetical protein